MKLPTLSDQLLKHLQNARDWVRKQKITDDATFKNQRDFTTYSAETVGRELRKMEEDSIIAAIYGRRNTVLYRYIPPRLRSDYITVAERKKLGTDVYRRSKLTITN